MPIFILILCQRNKKKTDSIWAFQCLQDRCRNKNGRVNRIQRDFRLLKNFLWFIVFLRIKNVSLREENAQDIDHKEALKDNKIWSRNDICSLCYFDHSLQLKQRNSLVGKAVILLYWQLNESALHSVMTAGTILSKTTLLTVRQARK